MTKPLDGLPVLSIDQAEARDKLTRGGHCFWGYQQCLQMFWAIRNITAGAG